MSVKVSYIKNIYCDVQFCMLFFCMDAAITLQYQTLLTICNPRACSATVVKNVIQTLSKSKPHLHVKRKTKVVQGREIWWFVLHGEEAVLKNLDAEWEMIAIQTNWKIEPCFKTYPHETATVASSQNGSEVKTVTTVNHLHEHSTTDAANSIQLKDARNELSDSGPIRDHAAASTSTTPPRKMPLNTHTANNMSSSFLEVTTKTVQS